MSFNLTTEFIDESFEQLVQISGSQLVNGTGSLITNLDITSSNAVNALTASLLLGNVESASFASTATSASYATFAEGAGEVQFSDVTGKPSLVSSSAQIELVDTIGDLSGSRIVGLVPSASYAISASHEIIKEVSSSYADFAQTAGTAATATVATTANNVQYVNVTGKPTLVSGSSQIDVNLTTGNIAATRVIGTVSNAATASIANIATLATTATNATSASHAINSNVSNQTKVLEVAQDVGFGIALIAPGGISPLLYPADYQFFYNPGTSILTAPTINATGNILTTGDFIGNLTGTADSASVATTAQSATSASYALTASYAANVSAPEWNTILNKPNGIVSSSIQLSINGTTGDLSGSRVVGTVASALSASHAIIADSALTANTVVSASHAVSADNSLTANVALSVDGANVEGTVSSASYVTGQENYAKVNQSNTFVGTQNFNTISAVSASIGNINFVTGSATIIGDAFVVLNADTPTLRYAGLKIFDSGSNNATASLEWDGDQDTWIAMEETGNTSAIITGPTGSRGSETFTTKNKLQKGLGWNYIGDSNISDTGTEVIINSNTEITGSLTVTGNINGTLNGQANTALSASSLAFGNVYDKPTLVSSSAQINLSQATGTAGAALVASEVVVASEASNATYYIPFVDTLSGTDFNRVDPGITYNPFTNALNVTGTITSTFSGNLTGDVVGNASTATTATTATSASSVHWLGVYAKPTGLVSQSVQVDIEQTTNYSTLQTNISGSISATSASIASDIATKDAQNVKLTGNQSVGGVKTFTGQVLGSVNTVSIASNTGSIDASLGNFFTITLQNGIDTLLTVSNITAGQTINLRVVNNATSAGTLSFSSDFKFPEGTPPTVTATADAVDIITFISFDTSTLNGTSVLNLS